MLRKIGFSLLLTALAAAARSEAQTNRLLSLRDCIQLALQHNYDVQIERLTPETRATVLRAAELPDMVRGYEEIKLRNAERFRAEAARLEAELRS